MSGAGEIGIRALTQKLGDAFSRRGWEDPESLAFAIAQSARQTEVLDPAAAAELASPIFLERNGIKVTELEDVVADAFSRHSLMPVDRDHPDGVTHSSNTFEISGSHNYVANVNLGGSQVVLGSATGKEEILEAISDLVRRSLEGPLNLADLTELDKFLNDRADIELQDVETAAEEAIEQVNPDSGKLAQFRQAVLSSAASGLLVQAIIAVTNSL